MDEQKLPVELFMESEFIYFPKGSALITDVSPFMSSLGASDAFSPGPDHSGHCPDAQVTDMKIQGCLARHSLLSE